MKTVAVLLGVEFPQETGASYCSWRGRQTSRTGDLQSPVLSVGGFKRRSLGLKPRPPSRVERRGRSIPRRLTLNAGCRFVSNS
jgi:hypothetical protein